MIEVLNTCYKFVVDLGVDLIAFCASIMTWAGDSLVQLDHSWPRTTGLLIGIALAWLMMRRDRHPFIRAISAPLKLVIDILDLAWDHSAEFVGDTLGTVWGWCKGSVGWCWSKVTGACSWVVRCLENAKSKLTKAKDD